jgi:PAS domain-containing protein
MLPIFIEELVTVAEGRTFLEAEALLNTVRGNPIWVLFTMRLPPTSEKLDRVLFSLLDITERKRAEATTARLAIVQSSDDGTITSWNDGAKRLFGYVTEEVVGRPVSLLILSDRANEEPGGSSA